MRRGKSIHDLETDTIPPTKKGVNKRVLEDRGAVRLFAINSLVLDPTVS